MRDHNQRERADRGRDRDVAEQLDEHVVGQCMG
jgi:hypothetical protein